MKNFQVDNNTKSKSVSEPHFPKSHSDDTLAQSYRALEITDFQGFHTYIHTFTITSKRQFNKYWKDCFQHSSLYLDSASSEHSFDLFMQRLWKEENSGSSHRNNNTRARYLYCSKIMLPLSIDVQKEADFEKVEHFLTCLNHELFSTKDGDLPFFFGFYKVQTCTYIFLFHTERYYYPEGKMTPVIQQSDIYLRKSDNHMCKSTDPDAYLYLAKGTVVKEKFIYFTTKHRVFNYSNRKQKYELRARMKTVLISHLYNVETDEFASNSLDQLRPIFGRLNYDNIKQTELALKYIEWNKILIKCEDVLYNYILDLQEAGLYDDVKSIILGFIGDWRKKTIQRDFTLPTNGRKKIKMRVRFNDSFDDFYANMHDGIFYAFSRAFEDIKKTISKKLHTAYEYSF